MKDSNFLSPPSPIEKLSIKLPCPFSAQGMLQPKNVQPPPMFGPRGTTIPPKFLPKPRPQHHKFTNTNNFIRSPNSRQRNPNFRHNRPPSNHHHNKQQRFETPAQQQLPNSFWCETCDRGFYTDAHLQQHISEHQNCGIDGCQFTGHELMVSKHIELQHSTGLYDKIKNLQTPEEIEKWREERRRRYPSQKNIEQRQQAQAERKKRGELLSDSKCRFGQQRDRNRSSSSSVSGKNDKKFVKQQPNHSKNRRNQKRNVNETTVAKVDDVIVANDECCIGMFRGTSLMENYKTNIVTVPPKVEINALSSLAGMYGSDDSSGDDSDSSIDDKKDDFIISEHLINRKKLVDEIVSDFQVTESVIPSTESVISSDMQMECEIHDNEEKIDDGDGEPPDEQPVARATDVEIPPNTKNASNSPAVHKRKRKRKGAAVVEKRSNITLLDLEKRYRNQNTMLEKLLQKDIRHERNVLLQCVRHVVQNNFFGIGIENKSTKSPVAVDDEIK